MTEHGRLFLRKQIHYYLTLAVIFTTLFSRFNLNSYLIILLLLCRLIDGNPKTVLKTAFRSLYFRAFVVIFLIELAGLLHTHDFNAAWKHMESKATLVAIPLILLGGPFTDNKGYRKLLTSYSLLLAATCLFCLAGAAVEYHWQHDSNVFFYHQLTSPIGVNATFFSGYVLVAILFLLFTKADTFFRVSLIVFFTGLMLLLSSRVVLALLAMAFIAYAVGRCRRERKHLTASFSVILLVALGLGALAFTDNPFSRRYRELSPERVSTSMRLEPIRESGINGVSLRLFMWRTAFSILTEQHAWMIGVSGGDSQLRLDQKYLDAGLSQGFLGYNFHDEYIEVLVRSGISGWLLFMLSIAAQIALARAAGTPAALFTTAMVVVLCVTESVLEMQHGLFLCCFFPILHLYSREDLLSLTAERSYSAPPPAGSQLSRSGPG